MAKQVLLNVRYFVGPADLTGHSNKVELIDAMEEKETTNYGSSGAKELLAGVETVAIAAEGQWDVGDPGKPDNAFWTARRVVEAHTACAETAAVGALAYLTQAVRLDAKLFTAVGEVMPWMLTAGGSWPLSRGMVLSAPGTAITASADGAAVNLGAVAAGQRLYGALHVLSVAGTLVPELTVIVESDTVQAFSGSPETRLAFATATAVGSEIKRTAIGAHADTWYRASFDVDDNGGTGESFLALVAIGIA